MLQIIHLYEKCD